MIGRARLQFAKQSLTSRCPGPGEILADRMAARRRQAKADDGYARETFTQPREQARQTARAFLDRWPAAAYMSAVGT
jgi:hypothetical protein